MYHFLLVLCSNNVLHHIWYITTQTVYVTACDHEKSFSFNETAEITGHMRSPIHIY